MVYRGDVGDALPTERKRIFLANSITEKVVFSVLDILSVIVQQVEFQMVPPLIDVENRPSIRPLTVMLKLFFSENEPSKHFQWRFGTHPNVLRSYITEQRARRAIFDQVRL
jgi:hypothetical protein